MTRVSVIISTYNRAKLLGEAIDSVLSQSFQDVEIIVVDDGSTDDTRQQLEAFGERVQYLRLDHSGRPGYVRNRGIARARGEMLAFLDDDDFWYPTKLARQVELLDFKRELGLVYCDAVLLERDGSLSAPVLATRHKRGERLFDELLAGCIIASDSVLLRRSLLDHVGLFDEALATSEDYDLWLRVARVCRSGCVDEPLLVVRRHGGSRSRQSEIANYRNAILVLRRALEREQLPARQRRRGRMTLARWSAHLGHILVEAGDREGAMRYLWAAVGLNPWRRRAWSDLARCYRDSGSRRKHERQDGE